MSKFAPPPQQLKFRRGDEFDFQLVIPISLDATANILSAGVILFDEAKQRTSIATGTNALILDTGTNVVSNTGTLEATGAGGLVIHSDVANSGSLWANGGNITIDGAVTGSGTVQIDCQATVAFGAASSENTIFGQGAGTLELSQSDEFTGAISGFGTNDRIDLSNIAFATSMTASYAPNQDGTGGTLTVSDGIVTANIAFVGDYQATGFQVASDGQGGSVVTYAPPSDGAAAGDAAPGSVPIPDVFAFKPDFGNVTVSDFNPGFDSIEIDHSIFADAAALLAATQDDGLGNAVVTADAHDTITLLNVTKSQLSAHQGDFHVT